MGRRSVFRLSAAAVAALALAGGATLVAVGSAAAANGNGPQGGPPTATPPTATPVKHLVVVFQENVSFDHYFGTYPMAANTDGQRFTAAPGTPAVNGLGDPSDPNAPLLFHNPNGANPSRLGPANALTCDQNHDYMPEQQAFDRGLMDAFLKFTQDPSCTTPPNVVMDYYDGNTVTALWNYAQAYAMSDNSYGTTFGPSTPGALNLVSGQTHGATPADSSGSSSNGTVIGDPDPTYDDCSGSTTVAMSGRNIGDMLSTAHVSWGWFQGGFRPTSTAGGKAVCASSHKNIGGQTQSDYSAHHEPFQYYASTANPHHVAPASEAEIGHDGSANHQYDLTDFYSALDHHDLPAVSFVKAAKYQDGHAGYSDPLDEQTFLVGLINRLEKSPEWSSTAVVISYDDSDGWYDHQMSPIVNSSQSADDALSAPGQCGNGTPTGPYTGRCGYGPRLPLLVISPFAKANFVDSSLTDQSSILRFVEDNWLAGQRVEPLGPTGPTPDTLYGSFDNYAGSLGNLFDFSHPSNKTLILDPSTGQPTKG